MLKSVLSPPLSLRLRRRDSLRYARLIIVAAPVLNNRWRRYLRMTDDYKIKCNFMDAIQGEAAALKDLRKQKESYESKLRDELTRDQKALEKEKAEIEKSQDVLSRDALQRRVVDYQNRVTKLQRDLTERAQSIEVAFQNALNEVQAKHLDPLIEGIIAKKNLSLVIDGRFARVGNDAQNLDITDEVISALNKKVSNVKMAPPKGF